ncbi:MAG: hypothetical protein GOU97_01745 [Nanoarchaeota archaeon]|nr:hypothetical protein [Nanoarchaeota archaeon]
MQGLAKLFLLSTFSLIFLNTALAYSCQGNEMRWTCNTTNMTTCGSDPTCIDFSGTTCSFFRESFTLQRCVSPTTYVQGSDVFAYSTIKTYNDSAYNLKFDWDGVVVNQNCSGGRYNVLNVEVRNNTFNGTLINNTSMFCSGNLCGNSSIAGYQSFTLLFTSISNTTVIVFRTQSSQAVQIKIKNVDVSGESLPCQANCGGSPYCEDYLPNHNFSVCNITTASSFSDDGCDANCDLVYSGVCRTSGYHSSCSAATVCANFTVNTCLNDTKLCSADCTYRDRDEDRAYCEVQSSSCSNATWVNNACCGDDVSEYVTNCTIINGTCSSQACCLFETNCVWNSVCYSHGTTLNPGTTCNPSLACDNGSWIRTITSQNCRTCGKWVSEVDRCCFSDVSFDYEGGYCNNGILQPFSFSVNPWTEHFLQDTVVLFNMTLNTKLPSLTLNITYNLLSEGTVLQEFSATKIVANGTTVFTEIMSLPEATPLGEYSLVAKTTYNSTPVTSSPARIFVVRELTQNQTEENQTLLGEDLVLTVEDTTGQTLVIIAVFAVIGVVMMSIVVYLRQNL